MIDRPQNSNGPSNLGMGFTWRDAIANMSPTGYVRNGRPSFSPNARDSETTAIELAITLNRLDWLGTLLDAGGNVDDFLGASMTSYGHQAIRHGNHKALALLIDHGYRLGYCDRGGRNDAHHCALTNSATTVACCTAHPTILLVKDRKGYAPYHLAFQEQHVAIARVMLRAMPEDACDPSGASAIHYAARCNDHTVIADALRLSSVNAVDALGRTPLHHAVPRGGYRMALELLAAGADPGARDAFGRTPEQGMEDATYDSQSTLIRHLLSS